MDNKIYSIIVSFNGEDWIRKCLDSLINSKTSSHIIVVDNNSSDSTVNIIRDEYPDVELIISKENLGFGRANNIGFNRAIEDKADYVFLLNQDAWLINDALGVLTEVSENHPEYGIIAPMNLSKDESNYELAFLDEISGKNCPGLTNDLLRSGIKDIYEIKWYINACSWLIPVDFLKKVGGFDPLFDHYGEDVDLCQRASFHGYKIALSTQSEIAHAKDNFKPAISDKKLKRKKIIKNQMNNYFLLEFKKLNRKFTLFFVETILGELYKIIRNLILLKPQAVLIALITLGKILWKTPSILRSRRLSRKKGQAAFLTLN